MVWMGTFFTWEMCHGNCVFWRVHDHDQDHWVRIYFLIQCKNDVELLSKMD